MFVVLEVFLLTRVYLKNLYRDFNFIVYFIIINVDMKRVMIDLSIYKMFSDDFFFVAAYPDYQKFSS